MTITDPTRLGRGRFPLDAPPAEDGFIDLVEARLETLFDSEMNRWSGHHAPLGPGLTALSEFVLQGGKRIRPRFAYWGFRSGGGTDDDRLVDLAAAIELLHAFALIHDDVMDGSDTRRHRPTMHRHFADEHLRLGWRGENRRVGEGFAILLGDLAFAYSVRLLSEQPAEVHALFDEMRIELHVGQYLDLFHAADGRPSPAAAREIARFKTAKYSVERPLHMGAALCGASHLSQTFSVFGLAVGEAFQHRDDLLGVFGDPATTGKPSGDDLWAGKQTLLLQECRAHPEACRLGALEKVGTADLDHNHVEAIRCFMVDSGIVAGLERRINELVDLALTSLDGADLCDSTRSGLEAMARTSAWRIS